MSHIDPKARKERRFRVNMNHYQGEAIDALATLHRMQSATFLSQIIEAYLDSFKDAGATKQPSNEQSLKKFA